MKRKITLSGEVASGKTTIGKLLAEKLNYDFISLGNLVREKAQSEGLSIVEFQKKCIKYPSLDVEIDKDFAQKCNSEENLIIDYRLGYKFIDEAYHIFLSISEDLAVKRLQKQKRLNETYKTVRQRNESFKEQFKKSYGIDYTKSENYDLFIEITELQSSEEIVENILYNLTKIEQ